VFHKEKTCGLVGTSRKQFKEWFSGKVEGLPELHAQRSPFSPARNLRYQTKATKHIDSNQIKYNGKELCSKKLNKKFAA
jgi:hypothetical protein